MINRRAGKAREGRETLCDTLRNVAATRCCKKWPYVTSENHCHCDRIFSLRSFARISFKLVWIRAHICTIQRRNWSPTAAVNDPQTANDPQTGPQMIPNRKWSPMWTANDRIVKRGTAWSYYLFTYFLTSKDKLNKCKEKMLTTLTITFICNS